MFRLLLLLFGLVVLIPHPGAAADAPPTLPTLTPEQARAALDVLNDPQKRAAFIATLRAISQAAGAQAPTATASDPAGQSPAAPAAMPAGPLEPDSLGADVLLRATGFLKRTSARIMAGVATLQGAPLLWAWVVVMVTNPIGQNLLVHVGWRLAAALVLGFAAAWATSLLLRPTRTRLRERALQLVPEPPSPEERAEAGDLEAPSAASERWAQPFRRVWNGVVRLGVACLPLMALWMAGHLVAIATEGGPVDSALVIAAVLWAITLSQALIRTGHILLDPAEPRLRLLLVEDATATALMISLRRLIVIAVCGYAVAEVGLLLGLSSIGHEAILRGVGALLTIGTGLLIIGQRRTVRHLLRAPGDEAGIAARLRNRVAAVWHWIALALLAGLWLVWAADSAIRASAILHFAAWTVAVLIASRVLQFWALNLISRLALDDDQQAAAAPGLLERLRLYHPVVAAVTRMAILILTVLALMQVYGMGALSWLWSTPAGQRVMSGVVTLGVTIVAAVVGWELANAAIQRHLARLTRDAEVARSSRLRTLLPVLRTGLLITICIVAILMVLSEIGVNIAPLLAGAGILGVAIGFGSQKLVQDLITGLFLLLENAMQIGDVVNVSGLSGTVEGLSVRTITLRASDGATHIIPFSAVTSVTNHSRGVGNAEVRVTVDFDADTDRVADLLREIVTEMRGEPVFETRILKDLQLWGIDRIDAGGVTISGQVACTDTGRWSVQREINRRIKQRFRDERIQFFNQARPTTE